MKTVGILSIILLAMAMASADDDGARSGSLEVTDTNTIPQPATNPANVIYRIIQAPNTFTRSAQQVVQPATQQATFFTQPAFTRFVQQQAVQQPIFTRFVQQQPVQQPIFARIVQQQPVQQPIFTKFVQQQPVQQPIFTRTFIQPAVQTIPAPAFVQPALQPVVTRTDVQQPAVQQVAVKQAEPEAYDSNPSYSFGYEINAAESSVYNGHKETRRNGEVTGEYRILDPNGDLRITRYTAGVNGYNAEVEIQRNAGPVYDHVARREVEAPVAQQAPQFTLPASQFTQPAPQFNLPAPQFTLPATQTTTNTVVAPEPTPSSGEEDDSAEKKQSFVDANVLNLNRGSFFQAAPAGGSFLQAAPAPVAAPAAGIQYAYIAVPQSQAYRYLSGGNQQFFANPYSSYIRTVPFAAPAPAQAPATVSVRKEFAAQAPAATPFSSGTTFTRIVHSDGTTVEY